MTLPRLLLVLATLAFGIGVSLLMRWGWRNRLARQGDLAPLPVPTSTDADVVVSAVPGLYVGTTFADDWLDRVAVHRLAERATGWLEVRSDGVHVERDGMDDLYLPFGSIRSAVPGDALAGKVIGAGGLLLVDWLLGDRVLTTGFRADEHAEHRRLAAAITAHLPVSEAS